MHLDNLLFILLIAMAALFRLLASQAGDAKKRSQKPDQRSTATPQPDQPIRRAPVESDEERIRKFLEALGQPATSRPPPPVVPRTNIPPRRLAPVHPPPIPTARNVLARTKRKVVEVPKTPALASIFEVHEAPPSLTPKDSIKSPAEGYTTSTGPKAKLTGSVTDIATLLRSTAGLRNAIILREIFGPPRSLQPFDLIGSA